MEEKILAVADFSTEFTERESVDSKKKSLAGALGPLIIPIIIFIYLHTENLEFSNLDSVYKFFFWASIIFSGVLFVLHGEFLKSESKTNIKALDDAQKQSLIVSNKRIYGNQSGAFSFLYSDLKKIYSSQIVGNPTELIIMTNEGNLIKFKYVKNYSTIISIVSENILQNKTTEENLKEKAIVTDKETELLSENCNANSKANETQQSLYDVVIISASGSLNQIKVIRQITLLGLQEATELLSSLPCTLSQAQSFEVATDIANRLENSGIKVIINKVSTDSQQ